MVGIPMAISGGGGLPALDGLTFNRLGGLTFNGSSDSYAHGVLSRHVSASGWYVAAVATFDTAGSDNDPSGGGQKPLFIDGSALFGIALGSSQMLGYCFNSGFTTLSLAATTATKYGIEFSSDGTTMELRVSGVGLDTDTHKAPSSLAAAAVIGYSSSHSEYFDGTLHDFISVASPVDAVQRAAIREELATLHSITW